MNKKILLVGCGKMGSALTKGWLDADVKGSDIAIIEPIRENVENFLGEGVSQFDLLDELNEYSSPNFIIFAVKPQLMDKVVPPFKRFAKNSTFISIAAGISITHLETMLGKKSAIIRAMPNTPAAVKRGITIACGNTAVSKRDREKCLTLLAAVGEALWLEDESLIDAVTAISGSGPAYVFLLTETMRQAGIDAGLNHKIANELAVKTVAGSGELLLQASEDASVLRKDVTSPGGTTEAALSILMGKNGMQELINKAVSRAIIRSKELAN